jgi:hypothetical protein
MYDLLVQAMLIAALAQLGLKAADLTNLSSAGHMHRIESAARRVLSIEWRPISVFPDAAKRFTK